MPYLLAAVFFFSLLTTTLSPVLAHDKTPHEIGGFKLGSYIDDYEFISYRNFLKQVVIDKIPGFRKGVIEYGVCDRPGEIVRIKLKYLDSTTSFYKKLLKQYKKKFGAPHQFTGDSFGIVKTWKWRFTDSEGNKVNLLLQHNLKNPDETIGTIVKMYLPDQIQAERKCFNKACELRNPDAFSKDGKRIKLDESGRLQMIPR